MQELPNFTKWPEQENLPDGVEFEPELVEAQDRANVQAVFTGAAGKAARTIASIAAGESNPEERGLDKMRFDAAKYIVDRVLGSPSKAEAPATDPWRSLMERLKGGNPEVSGETHDESIGISDAEGSPG